MAYYDRLNADAQGILDYVSAFRQDFHRHPELSWCEFRTTAVLCRELQRLGFELSWGKTLWGDLRPHNLPPAEQLESAYRQAWQELGDDDPYLADMVGGYTGLVARLRCPKAGPHQAFRFDIDALPVTESGTCGHRPQEAGFASTFEGKMHACGHDGHMATGLGLARLLFERRDSLKGQFTLFFQPAEEVAGGGVHFARLPQLQDVQRFYSVHLGIVDRPVLVCDATWIAGSVFDVEMQGRSAHAGNNPEFGRNALLAACQAVTGLYGIARHSDGVSRVNVGGMSSDNANNVIADVTRFCFEVRGASNEIRDYMQARARQVIEGAAAMQEVEVSISLRTQFENHPNNPQLARWIKEQALEFGLEPEEVQDAYQVPASEDATYMTQVVNDQGGQGCHLVFGCPVKGGHHNPGFDLPDQLVAWGSSFYFHLAKAYDTEVK
ncbi:MAG: aminobenzoyl-glutamate utilization protein A [Motiliproteus sp.]|jgi:aminobenzoyl-glutamate utilization protein A